MKKIAQLSKEEIIHLASLAGLTLTEAEVEKFRRQLTETVEYVENLNELKTEGIKETSSPANLFNVFFTDGTENTRGFTEGEALANAKNKKGSLFVVKRIL